MHKPRLKIRRRLLKNRSGKPTGVALTMKEYERLMNILEDVVDVTWMRSQEKEERHAVPWEDVIRRSRSV